jgi:hypothetical protein
MMGWLIVGLLLVVSGASLLGMAYFTNRLSPGNPAESPGCAAVTNLGSLRV